jgi:ABC-2 type transport system ATP-binding protein
VGLDPRQIAEIRSLIKSLAGRRTIILSTHILPEVSMVCDRVVIINQGKVVESDTTANLSKKMSVSNMIRVEVEGPVGEVENYLSKLDKVQKVGRKDNEGAEDHGIFEIETDKDTDIRASIASGVIQKKWALKELRFVGLQLEDIFLRLVTSENKQETGDLGDGPVLVRTTEDAGPSPANTNAGERS